MLGSLVTRLLSCSPAEVLRVPGNKVNKPNIVEEDRDSHFSPPQGSRTSSKHKARTCQPQSCCPSPPEPALLRTPPPPSRILAGLAFGSSHSCLWSGRPPLLSLQGSGVGEAVVSFSNFSWKISETSLLGGRGGGWGPKIRGQAAQGVRASLHTL